MEILWKPYWTANSVELYIFILHLKQAPFANVSFIMEHF